MFVVTTVKVLPPGAAYISVMYAPLLAIPPATRVSLNLLVSMEITLSRGPHFGAA